MTTISQKQWTRRNFMKTVAAGALAAPFVAGNAWAETKPKSLIYSTYGGDYGKWVQGAFGAPFTEATGITLVHDIGQNPQRFAKLQANREHPKFEIITLQDRWLYKASKEGLLTEIDYSKVPNASGIPERYKHPTWFGYSYNSIGIVYNTEKVQNPPKTWEGLLDKRFKGKIFIDDISHFGLDYLVAIAFAYGGGYDNMDPAFDLIKQIKNRLDPIFISTSQQGMRLLGSGEVVIAMWQRARAIRLFLHGHPIGYITPETGDVSTLIGSGIVKNAPHFEWSEKYLNYTADPKLQADFTNNYLQVHPTNNNAHPSPKIEKLIARSPGAKELILDYGEILPRLAEWTQRWNETIAS